MQGELRSERKGRMRMRFLVRHDAGMSAQWWWVRAESAEAIVTACAEVEVVTDPKVRAAAEGWGLAELSLDEAGADGGGPLAELRALRDEQRTQPGFGALAGRTGPVYLRIPWEGDDGEEVYFLELAPDGGRLRQVEVAAADGGGVRTGVDDWAFNPAFDLHDPWYTAHEIGAAEFEAAWRAARGVNG